VAQPLPLVTRVDAGRLTEAELFGCEPGVFTSEHLIDAEVQRPARPLHGYAHAACL
jgi:hypothetical protein